MGKDLNKIKPYKLLINPNDWLDKKTGKLTYETYNDLILYIVNIAGDKFSYKNACKQIKEIVKLKEGEDGKER